MTLGSSAVLNPKNARPAVIMNYLKFACLVLLALGPPPSRAAFDNRRQPHFSNSSHSSLHLCSKPRATAVPPEWQGPDSIQSQAPAPLPPPSATITPAVVPDPPALKWDAETKEVNPIPGEESAVLSFVVTNASQKDIMINSLFTSCGCTVAQLPSTPYKLDPGANVSIAVTLNLRGKVGTLAKTVTVETSVGTKSLLVRANIPPAPAGTAPAASLAAPIASGAMPVAIGGLPASSGARPVASGALPAAPAAAPAARSMGDRAMNIQNALTDRQSVFKGDCASCHVDQGAGKTGVALYTASCGICHESENRASMVPDLKIPRGPRDLAFWQKWITEGKPGTLMPAFAATHGGPLSKDQIDSLCAWLQQRYPGHSQTAAVTPPTQPATP